MLSINTNISSLMAMNSLAQSQNQLQTSLTRLSTGLRINSAADDPSGMIANEELQTEIANTNQAVANSQSASEMISTADSALSQIDTLLTSIGTLVTQAANTGSMSAGPDLGQPTPSRLLSGGHQSDRTIHPVRR